MSRRRGVVTIPDRLDSPEEQKTGRVRPRANLVAGGPRGRKPKRRVPSSDSDSSQSLFRIDDAAAFKVALTEGDTFKNTGQYKRAIQSYSRALEKQPVHRGCLLARSQCYQQVGDNRRALADANKALEEDNKFIKGLLQKAECYYNMGEFEYALVNYHRGNKLRPEIQAFRLGVQKSQAAIENCIGESAGIWLTKEGDLSFFADEQKPDAAKRREAELASAADAERNERGGAPRSPRRRAALGPGGSKARDQSNRDKQTVKQLLGELYADKEYLEKLLDETEKSSKSKSKEVVVDLTTTCLDYLEKRTDFWSQQQPRKPGGNQDTSQDVNDIKRHLKDINDALDKKEYRRAVKLCSKILTKLQDRPIDKYGRIISLTHSFKGRAHLEMDEKENAIRHHNADLEISTKSNIQEDIARAHENLVQVYLKYSEYEKVIEFFKETLERSSKPIEIAWLHHEIGKCHFEMQHFKKAAESAQNSLEAAHEANDLLWQLNANVLVAQSRYELLEYDAALSHFNEAYVIAERLNDRAAEKAIREAIHKVKEAMKPLSEDTYKKSTGFKEQKEEHELFEGKLDANEEKHDLHGGKNDKQKREEKIDLTAKDQVDSKESTKKATEAENKPEITVKEESNVDAINDTRIENADKKPDTVELRPEINDSETKTKTESKSDPDLDRTSTTNEIPNTVKLTDKSDASNVLADNRSEDKIETLEEDATERGGAGRESEENNEVKDESKHLHEQATAENEAKKDVLKPVVKYLISISISDLEGAETDEDIYVQLVGEAAVSRKEILERSSTSGSKYERGKSYTGSISVLDVGKILKVVISHNGTQPGAGCHIASVRLSVAEGESPQSYHFECNKWFDRGQDDRLTERELEPTEPVD